MSNDSLDGANRVAPSGAWRLPRHCFSILVSLVGAGGAQGGTMVADLRRRCRGARGPIPEATPNHRGPVGGGCSRRVAPGAAPVPAPCLRGER